MDNYALLCILMQARGDREEHVGERPDAANGKYNQEWGTLKACRACGQCQCFACHPDGPCVDERRFGRYAPVEAPAHATERWAS